MVCFLFVCLEEQSAGEIIPKFFVSFFSNKPPKLSMGSYNSTYYYSQIGSGVVWKIGFCSSWAGGHTLFLFVWWKNNETQCSLCENNGVAGVERGPAPAAQRKISQRIKKKTLRRMVHILSHHGSLCWGKTATVRCGEVGGRPMRSYKGNGLNKSSRIRCGVSVTDFSDHRYCALLRHLCIS